MANVAGYLSREDWIAAARKVLMTVGVDEVKVTALAGERYQWLEWLQLVSIHYRFDLDKHEYEAKD